MKPIDHAWVDLVECGPPGGPGPGLAEIKPSARLYPQVELQGSVNALGPLVAPAEALCLSAEKQEHILKRMRLCAMARPMADEPAGNDPGAPAQLGPVAAAAPARSLNATQALAMLKRRLAWVPFAIARMADGAPASLPSLAHDNGQLELALGMHPLIAGKLHFHLLQALDHGHFGFPPLLGAPHVEGGLARKAVFTTQGGNRHAGLILPENVANPAVNASWSFHGTPPLLRYYGIFCL